MHRHLRTILGALAINAAFGAVFGILLAVGRGSESVMALARSATVSIVYANLIGLPCWFGIDALFHRFADRSRVLLWTGLIAIVGVCELRNRKIRGGNKFYVQCSGDKAPKLER